MDKFVNNLLDTLFLFGGVGLMVSSGIESLNKTGITPAVLVLMFLGLVFFYIYNAIKED